MGNKDTILKISKNLGLSHIGSNLSVLSVLEEIYKKKKLGDKVILDNAHAHLAHLVVKAQHINNVNVIDAIAYLIEKWGIHCDRKAGCDALGGSLGHGLGISIGYALANPKTTVYCVLSDGSMQEGSNWEALRIMGNLKIKNIELHLNANGYSAVAEIDTKELKRRMRQFVQVKVHKTYNGLKELEGIQGHYKIL